MTAWWVWVLRHLAAHRPDRFAQWFDAVFATKPLGTKSDGTPVRYQHLPAAIRSLTFTTALDDFRQQHGYGRLSWWQNVRAVWQYGYAMVPAVRQRNKEAKCKTW